MLNWVLLRNGRVKCERNYSDVMYFEEVIKTKSFILKQVKVCKRRQILSKRYHGHLDFLDWFWKGGRRVSNKRAELRT